MNKVDDRREDEKMNDDSGRSKICQQLVRIRKDMPTEVNALVLHKTQESRIERFIAIFLKSESPK